MPQDSPSQQCPVAPFDELLALRPDLVRCPYGVYRSARAGEPVAYNERLGAWVITRHEDVLNILLDAETFSSRMASGPSSVSGLAVKVLGDAGLPERTRKAAQRRLELSKSRVLLFSDPPEHSRQRSLVNKGFTPRRVAGLDGAVTELAHRLIDDFPDDQPVDIAPAFSIPIPMTIIASLLGVPPKMMDTFKGWSNAFTRGVGVLDHDRGAVIEMFDQVNAFYDYFTDELNKRRTKPVDDLLSDLLAARLDGEEPLTLDEILQMLVQFLVAGNETTTTLLTTAVWTLARNPDLQNRLRANPAELPAFIEEVMRLEAPIQGAWRVTVRDAEVSGVTIPADNMVYVVLGSANHDPAAFEQGDELSIERAGTRHLSFGRGEHVCLGMNLAKLESKVALGVLLERSENVQLGVPDAALAFYPSFVMHGIGSLPVRMTIRPR